MPNLIANKAYNIGFATGILLFIAVNLYVDRPPANPIGFCSHCLHEWGFPFRYFESGGYFTAERYLWFGLIGDVLIAVIFSFVIGLVFKFIWSKPAARRLK